MPKQHHVNISVGVKTTVEIEGRAREPGKLGKWFAKFVDVVRPQHSRGGLPARVQRLVNRRDDLYRETVTMIDTGETIHSIEEPLSAHQGHGSAKPGGKHR